MCFVPDSLTHKGLICALVNSNVRVAVELIFVPRQSSFMAKWVSREFTLRGVERSLVSPKSRDPTAQSVHGHNAPQVFTCILTYAGPRLQLCTPMVFSQSCYHISRQRNHGEWLPGEYAIYAIGS